MIFASRTRRGPDRYLRWKMGALVVGAVLILWGSKQGLSWPVWVGIAVLAVGVAMRFLPQPARGAEDDENGNKQQETR
jgi:hypothetical protein